MSWNDVTSSSGDEAAARAPREEVPGLLREAITFTATGRSHEWSDARVDMLAKAVIDMLVAPFAEDIRRIELQLPVELAAARQRERTAAYERAIRAPGGELQQASQALTELSSRHAGRTSS